MLSSSTSCFSSHNFFLKHNGDLFGFGWNGYNQIGNGGSESSIEPIKIMNNPRIKSIILGHCHSFILEENGDLYGCGLNTNGQLGTGDIEARTKFTHIASNVRKVSTTYRFTLVQKEDRNIFFTGQGMGKYKRALTYLHINNVKSFCCGFDHTVFLTDKGEVYVMGSNECEELGLNDKYIHTPTLLMVDKNIESITCGYENTIILTRNENKTSLKCFGRSINQTSLKYFDDNEVIKSVHCGAFHTFLLTEKGDVWGVGSNSLGQLSIGSYIDQPYFIKLNLKDITHITTGYSHSIFLNKNKEILVCGHQNRLGFNTEKAVNFAQKLSFDGVYLIQNNEVMDTWSPDLHKEFPNDFKKSVFTFIMCAKMIFLHTKNMKFPIKFPKPLLYIIITFSHQMKRSYKMKTNNYIRVFDSTNKSYKGKVSSRPSQEFKTVNF